MAFLIPYNELSPTQTAIIRNISREDSSLFVEGPPGSGKTLISLYTLRDIVETATVKPLLLMYNHSLYGYLKTAVQELDLSDNITIATKDKYFWDLAREHKIYPQGGTYDEKYSGLLNQLLTVDLSKIYDIVLVDEVQDLRPQEWTLINKLAKRITSLGDFDQGIYDTQLTRAAVMQGAMNQRLKDIYRLPKNIAKLAEKFSRSGDSLSDKVKKEGNRLPQKFEVAPGSVHAKVIEILKGLSNVRQRIGVISPDPRLLTDLSGGLSAAGIDHDFYAQNRDLREHDFNSTKPLLLSSLSTKGLEFEHVILLGFYSNNGIVKRLQVENRLKDVIYVSLTRTNSSLYIITTDNTVPELKNLVIEKAPNVPDIVDIFG